MVRAAASGGLWSNVLYLQSPSCIRLSARQPGLCPPPPDKLLGVESPGQGIAELCAGRAVSVPQAERGLDLTIICIKISPQNLQFLLLSS